MSEKIISKSEINIYSPETHKQSRDMLSVLEKEANHSRNKHAESIDSIRKLIENHAQTGEKTNINNKLKAPAEQSHHYLTKKIKTEQYKKTLHITRQNLRSSEAVFSRFIHKPIVETISEVSVKIIARPVAIISGAIITIIGGLTVFVIAKKIGFTLPFSLIIVLYFSGYLFGLLLEVSARLIKRNIHQ